MKVQLQTNYSIGKFNQRTDKTGTLNNPSFKSTYELALPPSTQSIEAVGRMAQRLEDAGYKLLLRFFNTLMGRDGLRVSCDASQDAGMSALLHQIVQDERLIYGQGVRAYEAAGKHALGTAWLKDDKVTKGAREIFA